MKVKSFEVDPVHGSVPEKFSGRFEVEGAMSEVLDLINRLVAGNATIAANPVFEGHAPPPSPRVDPFSTPSVAPPAEAPATKPEPAKRTRAPKAEAAPKAEPPVNDAPAREPSVIQPVTPAVERVEYRGMTFEVWREGLTYHARVPNDAAEVYLRRLTHPGANRDDALEHTYALVEKAGKPAVAPAALPPSTYDVVPVGPATAEPAPPAVRVTPVTIPAPAETAAEPVVAPPGLMAATNFRQVMNWMLANGYALTEPDRITAEVTRLRAVVPALQRLAGDLSERVRRAIEVIEMEQAAGG